MIYCTVISTKYITDLGKLKRRHCLFIYCTSGMYTKFKIFVDFSFWASDAISIFFSYPDLSVFLITLLKYIERWSLSYSNTRFLILLFTSFRLSSLFSKKRNFEIFDVQKRCSQLLLTQTAVRVWKSGDTIPLHKKIFLV